MSANPYTKAIVFSLVFLFAQKLQSQCRDTIKVSGVTSVCKGRSTKITLNHPASTYTWMPGNLSGNVQTLSPSATTVYTIKSDDGAGCTDSISLTITVNPVPAASISFSGSACPGTPLSALISDSVEALYWKTTKSDTLLSAFSTWNNSAATVAGGNGAGNTANKLKNPDGIAIDASGNIYVADQKNNRVQKWAPGATSGTTVAGGNGAGSGANQLIFPAGIFVDASGNLYIADYGNDRVQKWAPGAASGTTVAGGSGYGNGAHQLAAPNDVFVDAYGNILIADQDNDRIQQWREGDTQGNTIAGGNGNGAAANQLNGPASIFKTINGDLYIADASNNRIQKWAAGSATGVTVAGKNDGTAGSDASSLNNPTGIWMDGLNNIIIADQGNNRVQVWAKNAAMGSTTVSSGIGLATDVFIDATGTGAIYVVDESNNAVKKYTHAAINNSYTPLLPKTSYRVFAQAFNGCYVQSPYALANDTTTPAAPSSLKGNFANLCGGTTAIYSVRKTSGVTFNWAVPANAAITSGQGTDSIHVTFTPAFTSGALSVSAVKTCATSAATTTNLTAVPATPTKINGFIGVSANKTNLAYSVYPKPSGAGATGVSYTWSVPAGATIINGQGTYLVHVNWGANSGNVDVYAQNTCGVSGTLHTPVTILTPFAATVKPLQDNTISNANIKAYPNPSTQAATIQFNAAEKGKCIVTVNDVNGNTLVKKEVNAVKGINQIVLDVSRFASGSYTVSVVDKNKKINSFRLVKQ